MDLSMRWLKEFVAIDPKPRAFAHAMTMSGSKVEGYAIEGSEIKNVLVGRVTAMERHPDSDHMFLCKVNVGQERDLQIVTGAQNVAVGSLVPAAVDGAVLPGGKKIKTGKLRGELSEGMLCSLSELGLTAHDFPHATEDGIFLLEEDCAVGQDLRDAIGFNDTCVEFEITPNRPDCLSVIGLAREAAATYHMPLTLHIPSVKGGGGEVRDVIDVTVENTELCPRYSCRVINHVRIAPSPRWMRERLRASGVRPRNNLVDITNYVMLEYGQPLHAFDAACIDGKKIVVRNARSGEVLTTLDGQPHELKPSMLMICDEKKPIAAAGVMGGENSSITGSTKTVVFESANFSGPSVRVTARDLGMRTDASSRFEKGLDPKNTAAALQRACELVELLGAGEVADGWIDIDSTPAEPTRVGFDPDWINHFLGIELDRADMEHILTLLGFTVEGDFLVVPSWRADVEHKADVAEEIARFYGYDKIPVTAIRGVAEALPTDEQKFERMLHRTLQACGCYEVSTYSFISPKYYDKINLPADSKLRDCVTILNPLGEDTSVMRTTTLPSMLEVLARNYNNRNAAFYGYELGQEYRKEAEGLLPEENQQITIGIYGNGCDFYTLKGIVETLLTRARVTDWEIHPASDNPSFHPGRCAVLEKNGKTLGVLGEVHPSVLDNYSIGTRVFLAKLDAQVLYALSGRVITYKALPKFPAATRDLSLLCDRSLPIAEIEKVINVSAGKFLEAVKLFDVYQGPQIAEDKKSVSYSLVLRSPDSTLTDAEADGAVTKALCALEKINVSLREK